MSYVDYYGKIVMEKINESGGKKLSTLEVGCIVLAGGKSTRLGRNKVAETIGNKSLLERVVSGLSALNSDIIIVTARESSLPRLNQYSRLKYVEDIYPGKGTIGGIYTGLSTSCNFLNLVVACDMPFIKLDLVRYMINQAESYEVVIPRTNNQILEPLHAIYSRNCLAPLEFLIQQGRLSVLELYPMVRVRYIEEDEIRKFDPEHISFFNVNTQTDLNAGRELARKEDIKSDKC
jgi:molybdenum cofactor guanylyltransferase